MVVKFRRFEGLGSYPKLRNLWWRSLSMVTLPRLQRILIYLFLCSLASQRRSQGASRDKQEREEENLQAYGLQEALSRCMHARSPKRAPPVARSRPGQSRSIIGQQHNSYGSSRSATTNTDEVEEREAFCVVASRRWGRFGFNFVIPLV